MIVRILKIYIFLGGHNILIYDIDLDSEQAVNQCRTFQNFKFTNNLYDVINFVFYTCVQVVPNMYLNGSTTILIYNQRPIVMLYYGG